MENLWSNNLNSLGLKENVLIFIKPVTNELQCKNLRSDEFFSCFFASQKCKLLQSTSDVSISQSFFPVWIVSQKSPLRNHVWVASKNTFVVFTSAVKKRYFRINKEYWLGQEVKVRTVNLWMKASGLRIGFLNADRRSG